MGGGNQYFVTVGSFASSTENIVGYRSNVAGAIAPTDRLLIFDDEVRIIRFERFFSTQPNVMYFGTTPLNHSRPADVLITRLDIDKTIRIQCLGNKNGEYWGQASSLDNLLFEKEDVGKTIPVLIKVEPSTLDI